MGRPSRKGGERLCRIDGKERKILSQGQERPHGFRPRTRSTRRGRRHRRKYLSGFGFEGPGEKCAPRLDEVSRPPSEYSFEYVGNHGNRRRESEERRRLYHAGLCPRMTPFEASDFSAILSPTVLK